jgi:hypothetical protein
MQPNLDVRRHSDGSIDFDFYRRRAARQHRLARRLIIGRSIALVARSVRTSVAAAARLVAAFSHGQQVRWLPRAAVALVLLGVVAFQVWAQSHDGPGGHAMIMPSELKWSDVPSLPPGAKIAVIEGPMSEAAPFTVRIKLPANYKVPAHWHPAIEHVTVLSGTFHMGMGDKLDITKTRALTPGGIAIMQPRSHHFGWTEVETIVQLHGVGPWGVTYVDPSDDPRKK